MTFRNNALKKLIIITKIVTFSSWDFKRGKRESTICIDTWFVTEEHESITGCLTIDSQTSPAVPNATILRFIV